MVTITYNNNITIVGDYLQYGLPYQMILYYNFFWSKLVRTNSYKTYCLYKCKLKVTEKQKNFADEIDSDEN